MYFFCNALQEYITQMLCFCYRNTLLQEIAFKHCLFPQVVRMLIVIVVLFGTLWLPYRIVVVYNSFQDNLLQFKDSWFWLFCRTMVFINSAINPIVYNMLSVKFRRAFRDIVCKGQTPSEF